MIFSLIIYSVKAREIIENLFFTSDKDWPVQRLGDVYSVHAFLSAAILEFFCGSCGPAEALGSCCLSTVGI